MLEINVIHKQRCVKQIAKIASIILFFTNAISPLKAQTVLEWFNLGLDAFRFQRIDEAAAYFIKTMELDPYSPDYPFYIGLCYHLTGRFNDAETAYENSLALGGSPDLILFQRGNLRWESGNIQGALEDYTKVIEGNGESVSAALLNKANLELNQGKYGMALKDYEAYLIKEPNAPDAQNIRRIIALIGADIQEAQLAEIKRAAEEAKRAAEEARSKALMADILESLKDSGEETKSIGAGSEDIRKQLEESTLED